jgi:DNA polymerase III epsilon subunit-like protein
VKRETDPGSVTSLLRRADPVWWWLRENFKLPSLAAIASVLAGAGVWLYNQRADVHGLEAQLKTLATSDQVAAVQRDVAGMRSDINDHDSRIDRIERYLDQAHAVAQERPRRRH